MKKILPFLILLVTHTLLYAQNKGLGKNDPEAKKILDAVSSKFKSYKAVQASFSVQSENAAGKSIGSKSGTVIMKGNKYKISVTGQDIYCDGNSVSTYDKSSNEITITKVDPSANTITPQKLFTNFYDQDFLYKLNGDKVESGKKLKEIELTPTDKGKPFFKVLLYIDAVANTIIKTKLFEKAGNKFTYAVKSINGSAKIADNQFGLDAKKYPGVEIVDLR
jgi:outer membrane lipoprotein carrier protein